MDRPLFALTGATGFAGRAVLNHLLRDSARVRALVRRRTSVDPSIAGKVDWVEGDLDSAPALEALVRGADVVIHLAGATKARRTSDFHAVNALGTARLADRARTANVRHFIHVSSLTALRPNISAYAKSKAESEILAAESRGSMSLSVVRAPAILGPDDSATASLFSALAKGFLPVPGGRAGLHQFSVLDVADAAAFIVTLANASHDGVRIVAPASHKRLSWSDIADSASRVLGKRVRQIRVAPGMLQIAGFISDAAAITTSRPQVFSGAKVRELLSGDWIADAQVPNPTPLDSTLARCLQPTLAPSLSKLAYRERY